MWAREYGEEVDDVSTGRVGGGGWEGVSVRERRLFRDRSRGMRRLPSVRNGENGCLLPVREEEEEEEEEEEGEVIDDVDADEEEERDCVVLAAAVEDVRGER